LAAAIGSTMPVKHLRIVESRGEKREDTHEGERTADQEDSANPHYRNIAHVPYPP
jgi:hypothetical protein